MSTGSRLRQVLASGLDEHLLLGRSCRGWRVEGETVVAELDDGGELEADVLVIADGACSPLTRQLAGGPTSSPCGLIGVAGRSPWQHLPRSTQSLLGQEPMLAIGPGGTAVFGSAHDPVGQAAASNDAVSGVHKGPGRDLGSHRRCGRPAAAAITTRRRHAASRPARSCCAAGTGPNPSCSCSMGATWAVYPPFAFTRPTPQSLAPWPASRVTALGDAVHV